MGAKLGLNAKVYRLTTGSRATWTARRPRRCHGRRAASLDEVTPIRT
jgi:hypothetical protein